MRRNVSIEYLKLPISNKMLPIRSKKVCIVYYKISEINHDFYHLQFFYMMGNEKVITMYKGASTNKPVYYLNLEFYYRNSEVHK